MYGNLNDLANLYQQMASDPVKVLGRKYNIPDSINTSDPNSILQHLLNTGQVSQAQVNRAMGLRSNPMVQMLLNRH